MKNKKWLALLFCSLFLIVAFTLTVFGEDLLTTTVLGEELSSANSPSSFFVLGAEQSTNPFIGTFWSLVPPFVAIALALITKEVYSSLFAGIFVGALLYSKFNIIGTFDTVVNEGLIASVEGTAGIFIFLVILGILVALINKSGGSAAFGRWAKAHVKTRAGAMLMTFIFGVLIFIDDYFNCLTVGSVMRPVTDSHNISRAKLAYLIDATAAPICMIAPVSSWAAAVAKYTSDIEGVSSLSLFCRAIPYNYYSLLTFVFIIALALMGFDFGPMKKHEDNAKNGDLFTFGSSVITDEDMEKGSERGRVFDLLIPVGVLIAVAVYALIYIGGFFGTDAWGDTACAGDFINAFGNTDASLALPLAGVFVLLFTMIYLIARRVVTFKEAMACVPKGFIAMVPAILILTLATSLNSITRFCLESGTFVSHVMEGAGEGLFKFIPAIVFIFAGVIAFATGTSWGTFGILIPIVLDIYQNDASNPLLIIAMSACLAGAVFGDHCSPVSDTTIMSSAGAQCEHVNHVSTQLPYAMTVAIVSFASYITAAFIENVWISLAVAVAFMMLTIFGIRFVNARKSK